MSSAKSSVGIQTTQFGIASSTKEPVKLYTLTNSLSTQIELIEIGASLRSLRVPSKNGSLVDVVLGFETLETYEQNKPYLGTIVGRVCNRIKVGQFVANNETYHLPINNGPNHLHGGIKGFSRVVWKTKAVGNDFVTFEYLSVDGEEGYPSTVRATVTYRLAIDANRLTIEFDAVNEGNKTSPISLTTHSYFNLAGVHQENVTIRGHQLTVFSDNYLPTDSDCLVTGEIRPVNGTAFDLRAPKLLDGPLDSPTQGYDNHFCNNATTTPKPLAVLSHPATGLTMSISGTQPGLQIYTAQFMNETGGKYGRDYGKHSGIAMEPQAYPDSVNNPKFPQIWVEPGGKYHQVTIFEFN